MILALVKTMLFNERQSKLTLVNGLQSKLCTCRCCSTSSYSLEAGYVFLGDGWAFLVQISNTAVYPKSRKNYIF